MTRSLILYTRQGGIDMYYYGGGSCGCGSMSNFWWPSYGCGWGSNQGSNYAIILVLFILLVIVIGARYSR